eukprot:14273-Eustigmatos_ZCMA.PRE.1
MLPHIIRRTGCPTRRNTVIDTLEGVRGACMDARAYLSSGSASGSWWGAASGSSWGLKSNTRSNTRG